MARQTINLPARCNLCNHAVDSAKFIGDADFAMVAANPCLRCGGSMYRDDDRDDDDCAILGSCFDYPTE